MSILYKIIFFIYLLSSLNASDSFITNDSIVIKSLPSSKNWLRIDDKQQEFDSNHINISYLRSTYISDISVGGEVIFGNDKQDSDNKYYYIGLLFNKSFEPFYINSLKPYLAGGIGLSHFKINSINGQKVTQEISNRYGILLFSVDVGLNYEIFHNNNKSLNLHIGYKGLTNYLTVDNRKKVELEDNSVHEVVYEGFAGPYFGLEYKF